MTHFYNIILLEIAIKQKLEHLFADSPDLSDITEGIDNDGGHRTSTPNISKRKRSSSMSTPELKQIRKQIEGTS